MRRIVKGMRPEFTPQCFITAPQCVCLMGGKAWLAHSGHIYTGKPWLSRKVLLAHAAPSMERSASAPELEKNQARTQQLRMTVTQNTIWNDCFLDLWRSRRCAAKAPGQPPANPMRCKVLSLVRHRPFLAADLSRAYALKAARLAARYNQATSTGNFPVKLDPATRTRKTTVNMRETLPFPDGVADEACLRTNATLLACGRPLVSRPSS